MTIAELEQLEQLACEVARAAGELIVGERPERLGVAATKSTATDVVTVMDRRSEELLRTRLEEARPADGVLGEEGSATSSRSGITWVVDPIDGTVNYLYELPGYAVSVAACTGDVHTPGQWEAIAGAVLNPSTGELFHARTGGGAFLEYAGRTTRLHVTKQADLAFSLIGTGFGYDPGKRRRQAAIVLDLIPQIRDIRRAGSAAVDLCSVAAGRLDGYYESGLNPWDLAAGWVIVTEASGVVRGVAGGPPSSDLVVAGCPEQVAALSPLVDR
ncbi:inositol monophosphatase family protein [Flexivirga caeni]|uniref:Inositol-1-monophosphatase n=1 Tax=Flexivirga caeni TaxID=2294115 RepID=A0A3M9LYR3_9MICO|nr:inositol monophosphatase family protein [Flexivirga caeni]RNI18372.1 inositol monophosphatase [Flexivirga caeni]